MVALGRFVVATLWVLLTGTLFFGFALLLGSAAFRTAVSLGLAGTEAEGVVVSVTRSVSGLWMVGVSRVYLRTAGRVNGGWGGAARGCGGLLFLGAHYFRYS